MKSRLTRLTRAKSLMVVSFVNLSIKRAKELASWRDSDKLPDTFIDMVAINEYRAISSNMLVAKLK